MGDRPTVTPLPINLLFKIEPLSSWQVFKFRWHQGSEEGEIFMTDTVVYRIDVFK
jgi:hypothetical protein